MIILKIVGAVLVVYALCVMSGSILECEVDIDKESK